MCASWNSVSVIDALPGQGSHVDLEAFEAVSSENRREARRGERNPVVSRRECRDSKGPIRGGRQGARPHDRVARDRHLNVGERRTGRVLRHADNRASGLTATLVGRGCRGRQQGDCEQRGDHVRLGQGLSLACAADSRTPPALSPSAGVDASDERAVDYLVSIVLTGMPADLYTKGAIFNRFNAFSRGDGGTR